MILALVLTTAEHFLDLPHSKILLSTVLLSGLLTSLLYRLFSQGLLFPWDFQQRLKVPYLGVVPHLKGGPNFDIHVEALQGFGELLPHNAKVLAWVGLEPGVGKTTLLALVAVNLARSGRRVLVVDGDIYHASLPDRLEVKIDEASKAWNDPSTSNWREAIVATNEPSLSLLPARRVQGREDDLPSLQPLLSAAAEEFDWVLVDTPSVKAIPAAVKMTQGCDGCILVLDCSTPVRQFEVQVLARLKSPAIGFMLNDAHNRETNTYYYYYKAAPEREKESG